MNTPFLKSSLQSATARLALPGVLLSLAVFAPPAFAQPVEPVKLDWLDGKPPAVQQSVSWGVPWPKGKVQKSDSFVLKAADGKAIPAQSWPMAYWPDGSIMWSGHSIAATPDMAGPLQIAVGAAAGARRRRSPARRTARRSPLTPAQSACACRSRGPTSSSPSPLATARSPRTASWSASWKTTRISRPPGPSAKKNSSAGSRTVTLEQQGPVRAVVKIEGDHKSTSSDRAWLPFVVRLYFSAGLDSIRIVHSFMFDSDGQKDFIKGLALSFSVPLREEVINRHVRFGGDEGMWAEPVEPLVGRRIITSGSQGRFSRPSLPGSAFPTPINMPRRNSNTSATSPTGTTTSSRRPARTVS